MLSRRNLGSFQQLGLALLLFCTLGFHGTALFAQAAPSLPPLADPATPAQIRQYVQLTGELDAYRARWIAAVDNNRSIGAPYWPEAFWTEVRIHMKNADLMPIYITWYQHTVSAELMQQVLDTYRKLGADHFQGSPAAVKFSKTQETSKSEMDKVLLANTANVINEVYAVYKPQIKAARAKYIAEHPDYKDK